MKLYKQRRIHFWSQVTIRNVHSNKVYNIWKKKKILFALTVNREIKITGKIVDLNLMVSGCQEMLVWWFHFVFGET